MANLTAQRPRGGRPERGRVARVGRLGLGIFALGALELARALGERRAGVAQNRVDRARARDIPQRDPTAEDRARARDGRGRSAERPRDIPRPGWRDILKRVIAKTSRTNLALIAAGVSFYAFVAIPSAFAALVALYGLVFDPAQVGQQIAAVQGVIPAEAEKLIADQLTNLTQHATATLGVGFLVSLVLALWGARSATSSLISAVNIAYDEEEKRSFIRFQIAAIVLTIAGVLFAVVSLALIALLPVVIDFLPLGDAGKLIANVARWPVLIVLVSIALAALYRFAPCRAEPRWRWVSWGAAAATLLWLVGSVLFSVYVSKFASYDKSYGSLGSVVVLLMWLYLSAFAVLFGAELNAEIEHQTARDSTTGPPEPLGRRNARMADTVGA